MECTALLYDYLESQFSCELLSILVAFCAGIQFPVCMGVLTTKYGNRAWYEPASRKLLIAYIASLERIFRGSLYATKFTVFTVFGFTFTGQVHDAV